MRRCTLKIRQRDRDEAVPIVRQREKVKQSLLIAAVVAMQLLGQLAIQLLLVREVGVGPATDAYIAAQAMPTVLGAVIITALQSVWLPRLAVLSTDVAGWRSEQAVAQGQAAILGVAILLVLGGTVWLWLPLFYPGLNLVQQRDAVGYSLILTAAAGFTTQSAILSVALRARDRFVASESIALFGTCVSLAAMYITLPHWGISAAAWTVLGRAVAVYIAQLHLAGWPPLSIPRGWRNREAWVLMRPLLFGASIYKTSPVVDRYWASQAPAGAITVLTLAQTAIAAGATVLERAFGTPVVPRLARLAAQRDFSDIRRVYRRFIAKMTLGTLLLAAVLMLLKSAFVDLLVSVLAIDSAFAHELWQLVVLMLGHLFAAVTGAVLVSVFYALNDMKSPVYIGIAGFSFGLVLKWYLFEQIGVTGLAVAASVYFVMNIVVFVIALEKKTSHSDKEV